MFYNLKIGIWNIKYTGLNPVEREYESCDKDGNILSKVSGKFEKGYYMNNQTGERTETAFKLINGKPYAKLSKTKEVSNYKEVDVSEVDDLLTERVYLVECDTLLQELTDSNKALKFGFTNGNGFKYYLAYICPSKLYKGYLMMYLGTTQISELIREIDEVKSKSKKLEQINIAVAGINRLRVEDLITL